MKKKIKQLSHQDNKCSCKFCKIVKKYPKNHLLDLFHKFMDDEGYDSKYIFEWNMPSWFRKEDLEDPAMFYFIILPHLADKYNIDMIEYIEKIPELKKWIMKASQNDIDEVFGPHEK